MLGDCKQIYTAQQDAFRSFKHEICVLNVSWLSFLHWLLLGLTWAWLPVQKERIVISWRRSDLWKLVWKCTNGSLFVFHLNISLVFHLCLNKCKMYHAYPYIPHHMFILSMQTRIFHEHPRISHCAEVRWVIIVKFLNVMQKPLIKTVCMEVGSPLKTLWLESGTHAAYYMKS